MLIPLLLVFRYDDFKELSKFAIKFLMHFCQWHLWPNGLSQLVNFESLALLHCGFESHHFGIAFGLVHVKNLSYSNYVLEYWWFYSIVHLPELMHGGTSSSSICESWSLQFDKQNKTKQTLLSIIYCIFVNPYTANHDCQAFAHRVTRRLVRFQAVCHSANMSSKF